MKLLRWTMAGASAYVIYKYAIGKKAQGEDVFKSPETASEPVAAASKPKRAPRKPKA